MDDVVLLASMASRDLQLSVEEFTTACEVAGMRISTSKSETVRVEYFGRKEVWASLLSALTAVTMT